MEEYGIPYIVKPINFIAFLVEKFAKSLVGERLFLVLVLDDVFQCRLNLASRHVFARLMLHTLVEEELQRVYAAGSHHVFS